MQRRKDHTVDKLRGGVERLMSRYGVTVKKGLGRLDADGSVAFVPAGEGSAEKLEADAVVIATGTASAMVPLPLPEGYEPMTTDELLSIQELPESLAIVGGGVIGVEMASVFARLGVHVEIIELLPEILAQLDGDLGRFAEGEFVKAGIGINKGVSTTAVTGGRGSLKVALSSGREFTVSDMLVAVGRRPQTAGLEAVGIALDRRGYIQVDGHLQTSRARACWPMSLRPRGSAAPRASWGRPTPWITK